MRLFYLLLAFLLFPMSSSAQLDMLVGGAPDYISLEECSSHAQHVITHNQIPENRIHSCSVRKEDLNGTPINLVHIEYGEAQDCPSGCFYEHIYMITPVDHSYLVTVPPPTMWLKQTLGSQKPFWDPKPIDFKCMQNFEDTIALQLDKLGEDIGWRIDLVDVYECTWFEVEKTEMTYEYKPIHTGTLIKRSFTGSVFAFMEQNEIKWNFDNLAIEEKAIKNEIRTE